MDICSIAVVDKRLLAMKIGNALAERHGRKRHHAVADIRAAARRMHFPEAWDCWALALYASAQDFAGYHLQTGERCDYHAMHDSMVAALADGSTNAVDAAPMQVADAAEVGGEPQAAAWFDNLMASFDHGDAHSDSFGDP
ncbi:MAG: hypothetical protein ACTHK2_16190 [Dokdonella sp.]|uniref:hypothetical protein n=1 Tax=Dokdonella sp. TaxID=2291710 RepID=UPI003F80ED8D